MFNGVVLVICKSQPKPDLIFLADSFLAFSIVKSVILSPVHIYFKLGNLSCIYDVAVMSIFFMTPCLLESVPVQDEYLSAIPDMISYLIYWKPDICKVLFRLKKIMIFSLFFISLSTLNPQFLLKKS